MMWPSPGPGHASYGAGGGLVDGAPVSSWPDSSGHGNTATGVGATRPTFKTNILNGKPVVRFTAAAGSLLSIPVISGAKPWTILAVMKPVASAFQVCSLGSSTFPSVIGPYYRNTSVYAFSDGANYYQQTTVGDLGGIFHVISVIASLPLIDLFGDGTSLTPTGFFAAALGNFDQIGSSATVGGSDGDIAELIFYNVQLSATDRANVEKGLGTKYAIAIAVGTAVQPDTVTGLVAWWKADSLL